MPETKMTKMKWGFVALLMVVIGAAAISRSVASNKQQDHSAHQQAQGKKEYQPVLVDGSKTPNAIPDLVAYEFLFNSVANGAGTTETDRIRAKHYIGKTNLKEQKQKLIIEKANGLKENIKTLDAQAKEIKDRNWPNPSSAVMAHLNQLQAQKEKMIREQIDTLRDQLSNEEKELLDLQIIEIKQKVKVFQPVPIEKFQKKK
jgi:hypothetical protein